MRKITPKKVMLAACHFYETRVARFLARYFSFLYWPLFKLFDLLGIRFVANVAPGIGHIVLEVDYFLRLSYLKQIDPKKKYVVLFPRSPIYGDFISLYRNKFWFASNNLLLYYFLLPLLIRYAQLLVDVGISRMKWQFPPKNEKVLLSEKTPFLYQISPQECIWQCQRCFSIKLQTPHYFPFLDIPYSADRLLEKWGLAGKKIALIQIKTQVINATAFPTDPETYVPTLSYLRDLRYHLIFVGREKMPPSFARFGIVNYAESEDASFKNDLLLFKSCDLALTSASGIHNLADVYNKPFLSVNTWHLNACPFGARSIFIPAIIRPKEGAFLTFREQFDLYLKVTHDSPEERFPHDRYVARNASADEILEACKELLQLAQGSIPFSSLQEKFRQIGGNRGLLPYSLIRPGQFFLQNHQHLLDHANT